MKPYVICHMVAMIDGRIDCEAVDEIVSADVYPYAMDKLECPSTLMGRVTMQVDHFADEEPFVPTDNSTLGEPLVNVAKESDGYVIALDTKGTLAWSTNELDGRPLLVITSEQCSKDYAETLKNKGISHIAIGKDAIDLSEALEILAERFGVKRLAIGGGGHINGAFLAAGLLDEVSLMIAPGIDAREGLVSVFDGVRKANCSPFKLKLKHIEQLDDEVVWLRYDVDNSK